MKKTRGRKSRDTVPLSEFLKDIFPTEKVSIRVLLRNGHDSRYGGRVLGRNWDKSLKSFPPCYS
jgi:hypothetical protein